MNTVAVFGVLGLVAVGCTNPLPAAERPAPTVTVLEADLAAHPRLAAHVARVGVQRHTARTPMGLAWHTTAVATTAGIVVDDDCSDGFCWAWNAPVPRSWWAVHEAGHTIPIPAWFETGEVSWVRGERWAQCVAAAVTGETRSAEPSYAYWACPVGLAARTGGELAAAELID